MDRLQLFPDSTRIVDDQLQIAGCDLNALALQYDTPLYLYDKATLDNAVLAYKKFLATHYPAPASITYAGKAYLSKAIAHWAWSQDLSIDCTGLGEIGIAVAANVPRQNILVHGVNKSHADVLAAIQHASVIVVDNLTELHRLVELAKEYALPDLWLRLQPGLAVDTHAYTQTGHADSKFGMDALQIKQAARVCKENDLPLKGIHFHQGSQFRDVEPLAHGVNVALDIAKEIDFGDDWHLSPGGGWGVAYHENELPHPNVEQYVYFTAASVVEGCTGRGLTLPHLHLEPGRSIAARAGVAIYRVGAIKQTLHRMWLLIDGGMADNPRPALYGARYSALPVSHPARPNDESVWIAGPYCESGDVLIEGLPFPAIEEGELIAVPMAGAYHLSMANNYNGARRPAVLMLDNGAAQLIQVRQTPEDLMQRDRLME
jgi:diaminopimelate decarboxylase